VSIDYEYEYVYTPHPGHDRQIPIGIEAPLIPMHWLTTRARHVCEKDAARYVYRYFLSYRSSLAAPPAKEDTELDDIRRRLLGVLRIEGPSASDKDIRDAYYREARRCHPDKAADAADDARFKAVSEAYRLLSGGALGPAAGT
jgi:hypothetical protein